MKTSNERQAAYRQRIKNTGGIYLGFYVRGEAAELVRKARASTGASLAKIATKAIVDSLGASTAMDPFEAVAEKRSAPQPETVRASTDYNWEEIK